MQLAVEALQHGPDLGVVLAVDRPKEVAASGCLFGQGQAPAARWLVYWPGVIQAFECGNDARKATKQNTLQQSLFEVCACLLLLVRGCDPCCSALPISIPCGNGDADQ